MPIFRVTNPTTGQKLKLTGDSPPTEQELDEIFAQYQQPQFAMSEDTVAGSAVSDETQAGPQALSTSSGPMDVAPPEPTAIPAPVQQEEVDYGGLSSEPRPPGVQPQPSFQNIDRRFGDEEAAGQYGSSLKAPAEEQSIANESLKGFSRGLDIVGMSGGAIAEYMGNRIGSEALKNTGEKIHDVYKKRYEHFKPGEYISGQVYSDEGGVNWDLLEKPA